MKNRHKILLQAAILLILFIPTATAAVFDSLDSVMGDVGKQIADLVKNQWFRFGLTFILFYMIMYAIYAAGLNKVSALRRKVQSTDLSLHLAFSGSGSKGFLPE